MKLIRRILRIALVFIGLVFVTMVVLLLVDAQRTAYLRIDKSEPAANDTYLIKNVNVIPMDLDTVLAGKTVYIKGGEIQEIADRIDVSEVAIIDAKGKFLTPGLIDMHVHVWDQYELGLYLSRGVTALRNVWGRPEHLRIREKVTSGKILSPLFYTSGPKLTGPEFIGDDNLQLTSPEEAKKKVLSYKESGYDFIKTYYGLTEDLFDAIIAQAEASDMDIIAHASQKVPYPYHFHPQIKSIEHAEDIVQLPLGYALDTVKLQGVIAGYSKSKHTSFCPTLTVYHNIYRMLMDDNILSSAPLELMNPLIRKVDSKAQFDRWHQAKLGDASVVPAIKKQHDFHLKIVKGLHDAGVPIICGTDSGIGVTVPGYSIHKELAFYKEAGLSNYEVLKTATVNASKTHAMMRSMGTVEKGKVANLLLVDHNPLLDLSALENPSTVFIKGIRIERGRLDDFEQRARNRKNLLASGIRYLEYLLFVR